MENCFPPLQGRFKGFVTGETGTPVLFILLFAFRVNGGTYFNLLSSSFKKSTAFVLHSSTVSRHDSSLSEDSSSSGFFCSSINLAFFSSVKALLSFLSSLGTFFAPRLRPFLPAILISADGLCFVSFGAKCDVVAKDWIGRRFSLISGSAGQPLVTPQDRISSTRCQKKIVGLATGTCNDDIEYIKAASPAFLSPGEGTWVFFGWVCAARDSKLAPRSRNNFP